MATTSDTLYKYVSKQNFLFSGWLFHCRIVLIALLCSFASNIYSQTDYAELEWVRTFFGPDFLDSEPKTLVIDKSGNSYVSINDYDSIRRMDIVTIRYNNSGMKEWETRYSRREDFSSDEVTKADIDDSGNIYISGTSLISTDTSYDKSYLTIKYNQGGVQQWIAITSIAHNIPVLSEPTGLAVDDSGNTYMVSRTTDMYKYEDGSALSVGVGLAASDIITLNNITNKKTLNLVWNLGIFYDIDNSLLTSLLITKKTDYMVNLNVYPGLIRIGKFSPGIWLAFNKDKNIIGGITAMWMPFGLGYSSK